MPRLTPAMCARLVGSRLQVPNQSHAEPEQRSIVARRAMFAVLSVLAGQAAAAQELNIYFGNLHSHTGYSDGVETPKVAYKHARDVAKLDFLAITEHNHSQAGQIAGNPSLYNGSDSASLISQASSFTKPDKFIAIYGQEFSSISAGNHANVFEVPNVIDEATVPNGRWDRLLNTWIPANLDSTGQPAFLLLNHPAQSSSPNDKEYGRDDFASDSEWRTALDARAELINIVNGPSHDATEPGSPSESEFRRYLNLGFHVAPTADQDNHRANWGSAANTRTAVIAESLTKARILEALRSRHVYATQDKDLKIIPRIGGHLIGTIIAGSSVPSVGSEIPIEVDINDSGEPLASYLIEVLADQIGGDESANVVRDVTAHGNGSVNISGVEYLGGNQYVYLRITQHHDDPDEGDKVWTAPVWFEPGTVLAIASPAPVSSTPAVVFAVDLVGELARVENSSAQSIDISGWRIVSTRGNQVFTFGAGTVLAPGESRTAVSGARADTVDASAGEVSWTEQNVWLNSGDPGELRNAQGELIATSS